MNTKLVNSAADVIHRALAQNRTAAGVATALESAQLLMSPEVASELERLRARVAELETAPTEIFRAEHPDSGITLGHYATAAAARAHCEATERRSWADHQAPTCDWIEDDEDRVAEMTAWVGSEESATGYVVTQVEVASEYDEEADE